MCSGFYYDEDAGNYTERQWLTPFTNYDNILYSTMTFFVVSTEESWPDVMYATIDSVGID
jgi:hypothetical protein